EDGNGTVDRDAADGARFDERRRMFERKDRVGRAGRGWKRADQRAEERTGTLDHHRGGDDYRRRHHHFERESVPEDEIGRHGTELLTAEADVDPRPALDGLIDDAVALGELEQLIELFLRRIGVDIEAEPDLRKADRRVLGDAERTAEIQIT